MGRLSVELEVNEVIRFFGIRTAVKQSNSQLSIKALPLRILIQAVTMLVDLEMSIKQGAVHANSIMPSLLVIARLFQPDYSRRF